MPARSTIGTLAGSQPVVRTAIVLALVAYGFVFTREPTRSDWYRCFFRAAELMQTGEMIHIVEDRPYAYQSIMALLTVPFARLGVDAGIWGWYVVNLAAIVVLWRTSWQLLDAPPLRSPFANSSATESERAANLQGWAVAVVGAIVASRFFFSALETRQFDLVIAAILSTGCLALRDGRDLRGAAWLGLAAGMKCTPLLFAPYLVWRGRLRSASLLVVVAAGVNLVPEFAFPKYDGGWYAVDWYDEFLSTAPRVPPGTWFSGLLQNQSLAGELQRLARYGLPTSTAVIAQAKLRPELVPTLRLTLYALSVGLLLATALCGGRFGRAWADDPTARNTPTNAVARATGRRRFALETSAVFALMLLLSPMTSRAHYVVLLLPTLLLVREAIERRRSIDLAVVGLLALFGPAVSKGLVGRTLGELTLAWGFPVWYAVVTLVALWALLLRESLPSYGTFALRRARLATPADLMA